MRIGYLFRGFLGDIKLDRNLNFLSTPDGNATYSWTIEWECNRRGWKLIPLGENLDEHSAREYGEEIFAAFSSDRRAKSYERMLRNGWVKNSDQKFPELDLVLIEWRWPIEGRNTLADKGSPNYQCDLERQFEVITEYGARGTPIVIWDLDHKLTLEDEKKLAGLSMNVNVIETSAKPRSFFCERKSVFPPHIQSELLQFDIKNFSPRYIMGYIGSRYERDDTIDQWIGTSNHRLFQDRKTKAIAFWGKWEPDDEVKKRWPNVEFKGRITTKDFLSAYSSVACVPLFAKQSYYDSGFITPRIAEAITFGSVPIGLNGHFGIEQHVDKVVSDRNELMSFAKLFKSMSSIRRRVYREEAAHKIKHMDVANFIDVLERLT